MAGGVITVHLLGGPMAGSRRQCLESDFKHTKKLEIKSMGYIYTYTLSRKFDENQWDAVYNAPKEDIITREDGIGGFGGRRLDY